MMRRAAVLGVILALAAAGCGSTAGSSAGTTSEKPAASAPARSSTAPATARVAAIRVRSSPYGRILVDPRGRTLYLFTRDSTGTSRCDGECARAWPPYVTVAARSAPGRGLQSFVGHVRRSNGAQQITYHGHPLYYYIGDRHPGQILCQDVEEFGGHWWVVSPTGAPVTASGPPCGKSAQ
jgi:predicted lipoprotein with Yx(FWY)xxD motif